MFTSIPIFRDEKTLYIPGAEMDLQSGVWSVSDRFPMEWAKPKDDRWLIPDPSHPGGLIILDQTPQFRITWLEQDGTRRKEVVLEDLELKNQPENPVFVNGWVHYGGVIISPSGDVFCYPHLDLSNFLNELGVDFPEMPEYSETLREIYGTRVSTEFVHTDGQATIWKMVTPRGLTLHIASGRKEVISFDYWKRGRPSFHLTPDGLWFASSSSTVGLLWGYRDRVLGTLAVDINLFFLHKLSVTANRNEWVVVANGYHGGAVFLFENGRPIKTIPGLCLTSEWKDVLGFRVWCDDVSGLWHKDDTDQKRRRWLLAILSPSQNPYPVTIENGIILGIAQFGNSACLWASNQFRNFLLFSNGTTFEGRDVAVNKSGILFLPDEAGVLFFFPEGDPNRMMVIPIPGEESARLIASKDDRFLVFLEGNKHLDDSKTLVLYLENGNPRFDVLED
ncbi:MAG: hypothetical protein QXT16_04515 [Candidatus Caldarchaeum sp.]